MLACEIRPTRKRVFCWMHYSYYRTHLLISVHYPNTQESWDPSPGRRRGILDGRSEPEDINCHQATRPSGRAAFGLPRRGDLAGCIRRADSQLHAHLGGVSADMTTTDHRLPLPPRRASANTLYAFPEQVFFDERNRKLATFALERRLGRGDICRSPIDHLAASAVGWGEGMKTLAVVRKGIYKERFGRGSPLSHRLLIAAIWMRISINY